MSALELELRLSRGANFQLDVATRLPGDRITGVYGPSGSGKTSLLYCIGGLLTADAGSRILHNGSTLQQGEQCVPPHQRDIACVFQDARLFPHLTVAGNVDYAWRRRRRDGPTPMELRDRLGLAAFWERRPSEISRGQQQRVAIARALACAPRLLLLDEPLANIDRQGRGELLSSLVELRRQLDLPMIYVSHDMAELAHLAEHLLVLNDGRVEAQGSLIDLSSRIDLALSHEEQAAAIIDARVKSHDLHYGLTELEVEGQTLFVASLPESPGTDMRLRLPARDISVCRIKPEQTSILNILRAEVADVETGQRSRVLLRLKVGNQHLLARVTRKSLDELALSQGDQVYAQVKSVALLSEAAGRSGETDHE